jgi:hypothetical protein
MLDISQAQRKLPPEAETDWARFSSFGAPPVSSVWIRDGISWGYTDPWYHYFRSMLDVRGYPNAPYHVLYPSQLPVEMWKKKRAIVGIDVLRRNRASMWDLELVLGMSRLMVTRRAYETTDLEAQATGNTPIIYTRPYFVRDSMEWDAPWYDNVLWVMALYRFDGRERNPMDIYAVLKERAMQKVGIPANRVIAVQTAKMGSGWLFGLQSRALDYDRWMGSTEEFDRLWGPR